MPKAKTPNTHAESHLPRRLERWQRRAKIAQRRRRQIQALLAGGLVLGVGATATVAAWTDQEDAFGEFQAGQFQIEATTDASWQSLDGPYEMEFDAAGMYPGQNMYASVLLRTTPQTTVDGALTVSGAGTAETLAQHLRYRAVASLLTPTEAEAFTCAADNFTTGADYIYGSAEALEESLSNARDSNQSHTVAAGQQDVVAYCFHVQLSTEAPNEIQGQSANHTWTWNAESVVPD